MNIDQEEINKFNHLSSEWWALNGQFKTLHQINPLRYEFIKRNINIKQKKIADIGCGGGILSEKLAQYTSYITAIDMSLSSIKAAKAHAEEQNLNINYIQTNLEAFSASNNEKFNIVTCMELLEHVPNPENIIKHCAEIIKNNGYVFFSTLNRTPKAFIGAIIAAEYIFKMVPKHTHHYHKFITPYELVSTAEKFNLMPVDIAGIHYNFFNKSFSLHSNCDINYMLAFRKVGS